MAHFLITNRHAPVWAPNDDGGTGGAGDAGAGAGDGAGAGGDAGAGAGAAAKWYEAESFTDEHRTMLTAKGLAADDPTEILPKLLDMQLNADRKLGADPSQLITKPKEGDSVADWMRKNGEFLGVPSDVEGYKIEKPDSWPEGSDWDASLETELKAAAHELGMSNAAAQKMAELYAGKVGALLTASEQSLSDATAEMMTALEKDWGGETQAKITAAKQAASVLMEAAGLDQAAMQNIAAVLKPKVGDAGTIRLFAAIADMMGDDKIAGAGKGATGFATTPAEARQRLQQLRAADGEYGKAVAESNRQEIARLQPEIERLSKIAAGS